MKGILTWIRANPITTSAAMTALGSVIWLFVIHANGVAFTNRISQRSQEIDRIRALQHTAVRIPPATSDEPDRQLQIPVNQAAIDQLDRVYKQLNQEYSEIFALAISLNQGQHVPMLKGLFPEPLDASYPFEARAKYRSLMTYMVGGRSKRPDYPRLDAGPPPSREAVNKILKQVEANFLANLLVPKRSAEELTGSQVQDLDKIKAQELYRFLEQHARSIHVYAEDQITSPDFPLDVGQWSNPGIRPLNSAIWEGQIGLWIQQDIVDVIARANRVDDPDFSVVNAPVKRLIRVRVVPGYVGLADARGSLAEASSPASDVGYVMGSAATPAAQGSGDADAQVPDDFSLSPTGRRSNAMYDVRHVNVSLVLDSGLMPVFFDHLHRVNFMTVLKMDVTAVDEYEAIREGYVYGSGDAVQVDMLIETIWLRRWTISYMPESVRNLLGVPRR